MPMPQIIFEKTEETVEESEKESVETEEDE